MNGSKRYRWTTALSVIIGGAVGGGVTGALMPTSTTLWAVREGLAWLAGGLITAFIFAGSERR